VEQNPELARALQAEFYRCRPALEQALRAPEVTAADRRLLQEADRLLKRYLPGAVGENALRR
jgi:hypothetical protein